MYEALTGRIPFGRKQQALTLKCELDPVPPAQLVPDPPADLSALCMELLQRDPGLRPRGGEILHRLGVGLPVHVEARRDSLFVGRRAQLEVLAAALGEVAGGRAATVYVHGPSGIGKSELVRHFLTSRSSNQSCSSSADAATRARP